MAAALQGWRLLHTEVQGFPASPTTQRLVATGVVTGATVVVVVVGVKNKGQSALLVAQQQRRRKPGGTAEPHKPALPLNRHVAPPWSREGP